MDWWEGLLAFLAGVVLPILFGRAGYIWGHMVGWREGFLDGIRHYPQVRAHLEELGEDHPLKGAVEEWLEAQERK